jgi:energy-coupling factor transport system substrate-specific component
VVGAVAGLTSDFFFGQGPWTPWQMAGWAATGLIGAGLATVFGARLGRWPLALVCAVVGFAFTALQDIGDWVTYSDHSAAQLGVYVGKGLGFDAVHAAGCLAFALLFGPSLARSVARFAARLQVSWRPPPEAIVPAVGVCILLASWLVAAPRAARAGGSPAEYLLGAQNTDGGYGPAPGEPSSQMYSAWAALGLASAGVNPSRVSHGGPTLVAYVSGGTGPSDDAGALERTILVLRAAGSHARGDLVAALGRRFGHDGSVSHQVNLTAFGVLALRAARAALPPGAVSWLLRQQNRDGGFSFASAGDMSDVDDTGAALEALGGIGAAAGARAHAVAFLRSQQNRDGGFPQQSGGDSNAQSTAWAIQGMLAAGVDPSSVHRGAGPSAVDYLRGLVAPDGHVRYAAGNDQTPVWVTGEALMALNGRPLPLAPPAAARAVRTTRHRRAVTRRHATIRPARHLAAPRHLHHSVRHVAPLRPDHAAVAEALARDAGLVTAILLAPVGLG